MTGAPDDSRIEAFRVVAERYCAFIEASDSLKRGEFVWQLAEHLVALYAAAMGWQLFATKLCSCFRPDASCIVGIQTAMS